MSVTGIEVLFLLFCGLSFGSFITLASWRLPRDEDIYITPSRCPHCRRQLSFRDLWPVISWLYNSGRCRNCKAAVSVRYPIIELITALLFITIYMRFGLNSVSILLDFMAVALMVMIVADFEQFIIPDEVHCLLLPLGLAWHYVNDTPWENVAGGFVLGAATGLLLHHGFRWVRKKEGLGYGDVKFLAIAGLWLGMYPFVPFLFFSGLFGVLTGAVWKLLNKGAIYPFGPSLALSMYVCIVYPEWPISFWNAGHYIGRLLE